MHPDDQHVARQLVGRVERREPDFVADSAQVVHVREESPSAVGEGEAPTGLERVLPCPESALELERGLAGAGVAEKARVAHAREIERLAVQPQRHVRLGPGGLEVEDRQGLARSHPKCDPGPGGGPPLRREQVEDHVDPRDVDPEGGGEQPRLVRGAGKGNSVTCIGEGALAAGASISAPQPWASRVARQRPRPSFRRAVCCRHALAPGRPPHRPSPAGPPPARRRP